MRFHLLPLLLLGACAVEPQSEWRSLSIDGQASSDFRVTTRAGAIVGGHDGCNAWGRSDPNGVITIDLQECPQNSLREAYWHLAAGKGATVTRDSGKLAIRARGHVGVFGTDD